MHDNKHINIMKKLFEFKDIKKKIKKIFHNM